MGALQFLKKLTGNLLPAQELLTARTFLFNAANAISSNKDVDGMMYQMCQMNVKNTFLNIKTAEETQAEENRDTAHWTPVKNTFIHFDDEAEFDDIADGIKHCLRITQ